MLTLPQGIRSQDTDFPELFSDLQLASRPSVVVAISGGSDSTALLMLLKAHIDRFALHTRPVAVTVDHALRQGSAAEAAEVGRLCASLGIAHRVLAWSDKKPSTGIPAAARDARHALLADAALSEGADTVLIGHTADDQTETVMMRRERVEAGRISRGLAGIAPATLVHGKVWFVRPFLQTRRQALRRYLVEKGVRWTDDPTNDDHRYERPRQRAALSGGDGTVVAEALAMARDMAEIRESTGRAAARLLDAHADMPARGLLRLSPDFPRSPDRAAAVYALRVLLAVMGGTEHLPDETRTETLFEELTSRESMRAVLSRALVDRRKAGIFILRETRGLPAFGLATGETIWDGRYLLPSEGGGSHHGIAAGAGRYDVPDSLLRLAADTVPDMVNAIPLLAPWSRYLPSFDLAPARAARRLIGSPEIPDPPFRGHNDSKA